MEFLKGDDILNGFPNLKIIFKRKYKRYNLLSILNRASSN